MSASFVLTAGGTGGHMFPAIALAGEMLRRGHRTALLTDARGAEYGKRVDGLAIHLVPSASPSRGGALGKLTFLLTLSRGAWVAGRKLRRLHPRAVVGFGGYGAFPTSFIAARQHLPLVLHEQNAYLGLANRKLARDAKGIAVAFDAVIGVPKHGVVVERTGNPVRADIVAVREIAYAAPTADGKLRLLVTGGSQGATVFSDVVPAAIGELDPSMRARLEIVQQCRAEDLARVKAAYDALGIAATLQNFFDDMPKRIAGAHLAICRAGASTVAELTAAGRPAILVPFPHAADDHQTHNARAIANAGAAWLMPQAEFTAEALAARLADFLRAPDQLIAAAAKARALGVPDAAQRLADFVERLTAPGGSS
ncbi:MAG: undecaprenyldiphospho-muramoylpentapeptide beta-N-acetylglucosaminyltransferase [Alphaproteobacteria bacterium]